MDKYNDMYDGWYNRRLFLWFLTFLAALYFFNETEGWLFFANATELITMQEYTLLIEENVWENLIIDSSVKGAE
jgi:hypothetical protein